MKNFLNIEIKSKNEYTKTQNDDEILKETEEYEEEIKELQKERYPNSWIIQIRKKENKFNRRIKDDFRRV
ncbi:hypothetical protein PIROE2DRAFT_8786 [Piromyces sp. E2]|nr:hypothetical protein PIROE2DRAFT_8786 [Piromyces sp. E2]|eukprot:OUM64471.1 hypothetical protein PIROE2DRAFT_8786 [Piromyces sp. E2]